MRKVMKITGLKEKKGKEISEEIHGEFDQNKCR